MSKTKDNTSKGRRARQLNVIYFVDSARTRSFKIPLSRLNGLIAIFFVLLLWSGASAYFLYAMTDDRQELSARFSQSLETIFKYESRYDSAYEIAYPKGRSVRTNITNREAVKSVAAIKKAAIESAAPKLVVKTDPKPVKAIKKAPQKLITQKIVNMGLSSNSDESSASKSAVEVSQTEATLKDDNLKLVFRITNMRSPKKVEGFVHAIAEFHHISGKKEFFGAPVGISVSPKGVAGRPKFAYRFSIRRFKVKKFNFKLPKDLNGNFVSIKIELTGPSGTPMGLYRVPLKVVKR